MRQHGRRLARLQVAKHKRYRLRMFAFEQPREMLGIHLLQRLRTARVQLV